MHVHREQFIIGPRGVAVFPNWVIVKLQHNIYLSHSPDLTVSFVKDEGGNPCYLLGFAVQTDQLKKNPIDEIRNSSCDTINNAYQSWAGRWILIENNMLHMDSSGLFGCFYSKKFPEEEFWVSSSAAILINLLSVDERPLRTILPFSGVRRINWYTPPASRFKSIYRLLPSQILELRRGVLLPRQLIQIPAKRLTYEELLDWIQNYLVITLKHISELSDNLWLPLTGGYDSRLLLAAAVYAGIPVKAYTNYYKHIIRSDLALPPKLAKAAGIKHFLHKRKTFSSDSADIYEKHTGGHNTDRERYYISYNYYDWCRNEDILLRAGVFEIGRCVLWQIFPNPLFSPDLPDADYILNGFQADFNQSLRNALIDWITWAKKIPNKDLDWRDRFFLEQRCAGWLSSVEQSLSLINAQRFHAANSNSYFSHVLQIPVEKRIKSQHHADLIKRMAPGLAAFPVNPPGFSIFRMLRGFKKSLIS